MNQEDKIFLVVAIAAAGFIAYKATRKDDVVAAGGYVNAAGGNRMLMLATDGVPQPSGGRIAQTQQPGKQAVPVRPPNSNASAKPMWMKQLEKKLTFWRKD